LLKEEASNATLEVWGLIVVLLAWRDAKGDMEEAFAKPLLADSWRG
jgi:hypothetical protein